MLVDSEERGSVRPGETLELTVPAGRHSVQMAIDWARSPSLDFDVAPGETVSLRCAPNTAQPGLVGATVGRGKYVSLWRTDGSEPEPGEDVMGFPRARFALLAALLAGAGLAFAYHAPATGFALALFAAVPGVVVAAWALVRIRRQRDTS